MHNIIFFFDYNNVVKIYAILKWIIKKFINAWINYQGMTHFLWHFITEIDLISKMKKLPSRVLICDEIYTIKERRADSIERRIYGWMKPTIQRQPSICITPFLPFLCRRRQFSDATASRLVSGSFWCNRNKHYK